MKVILFLAVIAGIIYVLADKLQMKDKETFRRKKW